MPTRIVTLWPELQRTTLLFCILALLPWAGCATSTPRPAVALERIVVAADGRGFVGRPSGTPFVPWGFNYDHDEPDHRLIEAYWHDEWDKVVTDFRAMRDLGATVIRIHVQFGRFMPTPSAPDARELARLSQLVSLAEELGLRLNLTGLGCYLKDEVPAWYDTLNEEERWAAQAAFWAAIAARCTGRPGVFCYNLMNEPVVPGGKRADGDWLGPPFAERFHFVQFITLDRAGRPRPQVAADWIRTLTTAIRQHDPDTLITVGLVDWSLDRPGLTSGFVPQVIGPELDFLSVHLYPRSGQLEAALDTLSGFHVGKPVVLEETFPLHCNFQEMLAFLAASRHDVAGWVSFYWGQTPAEARRDGSLRGAIVAEWIELFSAAMATWAVP